METVRVVDSKTRKILIDWVASFLWHLERLYSNNGPEECPEENCAIIIVDNILKVIEKDDKEMGSYQLPNPSSFFQLEWSHQG